MRPTPEPRLKGTYTTKRDGGLTYAYEGSWFVAYERIVWRARVSRDGKSRGVAHGEIVDPESLKEDDVRDAVRDLLTTAIEYLVQVEK